MLLINFVLTVVFYSFVLKLWIVNDETGHSTVETYTEKYTALGYKVHAVFSKEKDINEDFQKMGG